MSTWSTDPRGLDLRRRRLPARLAVGGALLCPSACAYTLETVNGVPAARDADVMSYAEYNSLDHLQPYVLHLGGDSGAVVYFGARHTTRPADPQIDSIETLWAHFRPTVALVETRRGWRGSLNGNVKQFGESSAGVAFARRDGIPVYTLDAPLETEIATLLGEWSRVRVTMFYVLRSYTARSPASRSDGQASELLRERGRWPGLGGVLTTVSGMDSAWAREFPGEAGWRELPWQATWPNRTDSWLNALAAHANRFRDQRMIALITTLVGRGERVFAIVGSSHVVMQERELREALGADTITAAGSRRHPR